MLFILSDTFNPYYNLASEEFLLKNSQEEIFMLWRSEPSVIIGKHQNTPAELNYRFVRENNLYVARRLSGGGTVVHDLQNLNFTFIANGTEGKLIDFKKFVAPIIDFLKTLGINAHIGKTNDIRIGDLKISGNAEHVYRKRVLHHGTLLFNSDLQRLSAAIKINPNVYFDKAVQSNRTTVTNIIEYLSNKISIEEFTNALAEHFMRAEPSSKPYCFSDEETQQINKLVSEKYSLEEWIYGYSPKYKFAKDFAFKGSMWSAELLVEKGKIVKSLVFMNEKPHVLSNLLENNQHLFDDVYKVLNECLWDLKEEELEDLTYQFF